MTMMFGHIELFVSDPMGLLPFYRDVLGAEVTTIQAERFVWLKLGTVEILLRPAAQPPPTAPDYNQARVGLVLYCQDLAATTAHLERQGIELQTGGIGADCYTFSDPAGNWFQLVDPTSH